jgi:hypothetical protein
MARVPAPWSRPYDGSDARCAVRSREYSKHIGAERLGVGLLDASPADLVQLPSYLDDDAEVISAVVAGKEGAVLDAPEPACEGLSESYRPRAKFWPRRAGRRFSG